MTALRVVLDPIVAPTSGEVGRYALELTRELIASAPAGIEVGGLVASSPTSVYDALRSQLPGLVDLRKSALEIGPLREIWRRGLGVPTGGMIHAPDLLAPLARRGHQATLGNQTVVTVHDTLAWTEPSWLAKGEASWRRSMIRRAERYAEAVIVPNHAVAESLAGQGSFGDRIRVISGGASTDLVRPVDAGARAELLGLPSRYLLAWSTGSAHRALGPLFRALSRTDGPTLPLVVLGASEVAEAAAAAGLDPSRVLALAPADPEDIATVLHRAAILVHPGPAEGFGLPVIDAMQAGVPVVHVDDPALEELTAEAALVVPRSSVAGYTATLAQQLEGLLGDEAMMQRLRTAGLDRARQFGWRDAAEKVWQLHADL